MKWFRRKLAALPADCDMCAQPIARPCTECGTEQMKRPILHAITVHKIDAAFHPRERINLCQECSTSFGDWARSRHADSCCCMGCRWDRRDAKRKGANHV